MSTLGLVQAFAKFGAVPVNQMWAVSAIASDGALVLSCWSHYFKPGAKGVLCYVDCLSRWTGNDPGNKLLRNHLDLAFAEKRPIRMVVATAENPALVEKVHDATTLKKTIHIREDVVGQLASWDQNNFVIEFRPA